SGSRRAWPGGGPRARRGARASRWPSSSSPTYSASARAAAGQATSRLGAAGRARMLRPSGRANRGGYPGPGQADEVVMTPSFRAFLASQRDAASEEMAEALAAAGMPEEYTTYGAERGIDLLLWALDQPDLEAQRAFLSERLAERRREGTSVQNAV